MSSQTTVEEVDFSTSTCTADFTKHLQEDIKTARSRRRKEPSLEESESVHVQDDETVKFLKKSKVCFLGQNIKNDHKIRKTRRHIVSQKESVFKNKTGKEVDYTFHKSAQDTTTAQLTIKKGFKIGVLAFLGGSMGGQGGLGVGAQYSRGKERMEQSSNASAREMQVQVSVPKGGSARVVETDYSTVYDAECDFDIGIKKSYKIKYSVAGDNKTGKHDFEIEAKELGDPDLEEDFDDEQENKFVHLRHSCKCKLETIEHDLEMELLDPEIDKSKREDERGNVPDTGSVHK